jgi:hypothetical protein
MSRTDTFSVSVSVSVSVPFADQIVAKLENDPNSQSYQKNNATVSFIQLNLRRLDPLCGDDYHYLHQQLDRCVNQILARLKKFKETTWDQQMHCVAIDFDDCTISRKFRSPPTYEYWSVETSTLLDVKLKRHGLRLLNIPHIWFGNDGVGGHDTVMFLLGLISRLTEEDQLP